MKRETLWFWTWCAIVGGSAVLLGAGLASRARLMQPLDPEIIAAVLAAIAGMLALLFQRRAEFVASLREEWKDCLEAVSAVRILYLARNADEQMYLNAYRALSRAVDGMRAVYRNVGEDDRHVGYFPFATLHDIRICLVEDFGEGSVPDAAYRKQRIEEFDAYWRAFRRAFLSELETPEPDKPILSRLVTDARKHGAHWWARLRGDVRRGGKLLQGSAVRRVRSAAWSTQPNPSASPEE